MTLTKYDFSGWATKNDLRCTDGRTIKRNAFIDDDGRSVPLVWQHQHNNPDNVLGHCVLKNCDEGVYAYGVFNNSDAANQAKELVRHGDIKSLSIYANQLKQQGGNVTHGIIREVSLVLAGANPGATIEFPVLAHADGTFEDIDDAAVIYTDENILLHEDSEDDGGDDMKDRTVDEVFNSFTKEQKDLLYYMIANAKSAKHSVFDDDYEYIEHEDDEEPEEGSNDAREILNSLDDDQKQVFYFLLGKSVEDSGEDEPEDDETEEDDNDEEMAQSDDYTGGYYGMKYNVFDNNTENEKPYVSHSDIEDIFANAKRCGSLKTSFEAFADVIQHSVEDIDYLFPDPKNLTNAPEFIKPQEEWVAQVWNATRKSPFSRIKTMFADLTEDEARAKGYIKGNQKLEEVFPLLKRVTTPQTIYKLQKMDRDDIIDITDFDVVAWIKKEMRGRLDAELSRAILIGDGRTIASPDRIDPDHIRPVWTDDEFYTMHKTVSYASNASNYDKAEAIIEAALRARKDYKGTGTPDAYFEPDMLTTMLLAKDVNGRRIYNSMADLAAALRVGKIHEVPVIENQVRKASDGSFHKLLGLIVNLHDYNVGADKQGAVNMFDDFDIDYNRYAYLIETRCSGALVTPKSCIALEMDVTDGTGATVSEMPTDSANYPRS